MKTLRPNKNDYPQDTWNESEWVEFLQEKMKILWPPDLSRAHTIDLVVRRDGQEKRYQADFLKYFQMHFGNKSALGNIQ